MADQQFMTLGTHCSEKYCNQLDFLPFKCPSCSEPFCSDHWRPPAGHTCPKYDPNREDNRIPSCPLCSTPVSHPPSTSPDAAMDDHLSTSCVVLNPNAVRAPSPGSMPTCQAARCKTKLVVPFGCEKCGNKFCASHRWASDHACAGKQAVANGGGAKAGGAKGALSGGAGVKGMAGLAALRRAQANLAAKKKAPAAPTASSSSFAGKAQPRNATNGSAPVGSAANPLVIDDSDDDVQIVDPKPKPTAKSTASKNLVSATGGVLGSKSDKRAAAERASARRALEARAKKGLLTEKEKLQYATEMALEAESRNGKKGDGCCLS